MKYYCGLDVSLNNTAICVVNQDGEVIRESEVPTEPVAISQYLKATGLPMERVGLEAGGLTPWLCHELLAADWPAICIETRHAKAAMQAQQVKTDRNDARGLAHIMRTGWFKEVHVKSHASQKLRVLLGNRRCLLDKRLDIDSQIRGTLKVFGHKTGKVTPATYERRIRELVNDDKELQAYIFPMLEVRRHLVQQCNVLEKMILDWVKKDEICGLFMTIPGIGPLTALAFKTFVDRPERFQHSKAVGAAVGLTPRKYASGEVDYDGHITKCGDAFLRSHLFEAAKVMLSRVGRPSALKVWGLRLAKRSSKKKACVAVARRLAVIMHDMWRDGTVFEVNEEAAAVMAA
ncbi:IS110 family RNA-guided transposase [Acidicapsa acidisoli]|uniref:IS110 family transposase n=1 Tax=Acidicapsa acidisoli TaxID=1615681 RepID=UPI0021DF9D91|nr:IS110 family transposase [Acidicapsa acidisoli]